MKTKRKRETISEENLHYKNVIVHIIMAFLVVYPFVVYSYVGLLSEKQQEYLPNKMGYTADFFLYHKEMLLLVFAVWLILFFIGEQIYPQKPFRDIPLRSKHARVTLGLIGIYALCIGASVLFSVDKKTAVWGGSTEYEGMAALLSYLILFLAGYNYFRAPRFRKILKRGLLVLMTVICLLALVEYFYKPIYEIDFLKYFIAPKEQRVMAESLSNQEYVGKITLSLYNPGYLGGLCSLLLPISFGIMYEEEARWRRLLCCFLHVGLWFTLLGTGVTGPFFAAAAGMAVLFVVMRKEGKKLIRSIGVSALFLVIVFFLVNLFTDGAIVRRFLNVVSNSSSEEETSERFVLTGLEISEDAIKVSSGEKSFYVRAELPGLVTPENFTFVNPSGRELQTAVDTSGTIHFLEEGYEAVRFACRDRRLCMDLGYDDTIDFYVTEHSFALVGQNGAAIGEIPQSSIQSESLKKLYPVATGRGYMWVNTLPILTECLFVGKGPGHFTYSFVQNDVVGLVNTHGSCKFVIDKPHNWYLQIAVGTGVISLLAVFALFFRYFKGGFAAYIIRAQADDGDIFEKGLWAGLLAFCVTGLVNDSIVTVNPVFWLLLGIGCCAVDNRKIK